MSAEDGRQYGEPDPISRAEYVGHEGRIIRLEEASKHFATREWVLWRGYAVMSFIALTATAITAAIIRAAVS